MTKTMLSAKHDTGPGAPPTQSNTSNDEKDVLALKAKLRTRTGQLRRHKDDNALLKSRIKSCAEFMLSTGVRRTVIEYLTGLTTDDLTALKKSMDEHGNSRVSVADFMAEQSNQEKEKAV